MKISTQQWRDFYLVLIFGLAAVDFSLLREHDLYNSAALYLGVPLILSLGLSLLPETKSAFVSTMKGIAICLLLSAILFDEGYICIIFAAPIFFGIGALISIPIDIARVWKNKRNKLQSSTIALIVALLSLEGTMEMTTLARDNQIRVSKVVNANITDIREQIAKPPVLGENKPFFLKIFPYPADITGEGLAVGDERTIKFVAYKHIWWHKVTGDLVLKIVESTPNAVKFETVKDDSYLSHYLKWQGSEVQLKPLNQNQTEVSWTLSYKRILDPAWYFSPMQHYAVKLAALELIDHMATPHA